MYEGEVNCAHYNGVKFTKVKTCCGGKKVTRNRIDCAVKRIVYADMECRRKICDRYAVRPVEIIKGEQI